MKKMYKYKYVLIIIALISVYFIFFRSSGNVDGTIVAHPKDFIVKLSVVGTVEAPETANLGFSQSGRISSVNAKVGDFVAAGSILSNIENGDLYATLMQKQAVLEKEKANLAAKVAGTRPEELSISEQKYEDAASAYVTALHTAYFKVEEAVLTDIDDVFTDGNSVNPTIDIVNDDRKLETDINLKRLKLTEKLSEWKDVISSLDSDSTNADLLTKSQRITIDTLNTAKTLISGLTVITADLGVNSGYTQAVIDAFRVSINDAGQEIQSASVTYDTAQASLNTARNNFSLDRAGYTPNELSAQTAVVKAAEADVLNAQSQLNKTIVRAPFDGIVTKMDAKIGEIVSSNTSNISMISNGLYLIKSNVPEVYISSLKVGNTASTTLDAFGPNKFFSLKVIAIDPAQTVVGGVSNYKTTLQFLSEDKMVRPGMTANVVIVTSEIPNAFVLPQGSIFTKDGKKFIQIKRGNKIVDQEVELGTASSVGEVQIVSGLSDGDEVVLNPK
jgi:HlyD family secretion protein